jgi:hypothetical protein
MMNAKDLAEEMRLNRLVGRTDAADGTYAADGPDNRRTIPYSELVTLTTLQAATILTALDHAIEKRIIPVNHGAHVMAAFSRASNPGCVMRFEASSRSDMTLAWWINN